MEMQLNNQKQAFSRAYVSAVAAVAGYTYQPAAEPDHDSVDACFAARGTAGTYKKPRLDAQLKCTADPINPDSDRISFVLSRKNYDDLREDCHVPRILIVVIVPSETSLWLAHSEAEMVLRHCGYWLSLKGAEEINTESKTVYLPRRQVFNPQSMTEIMGSIADRREA